MEALDCLYVVLGDPMEMGEEVPPKSTPNSLKVQIFEGYSSPWRSHGEP